MGHLDRSGTFRLTLAAWAGRTGRGVRVAIVDSGVHPRHPHVGPIAGGMAFDDAGREAGDLIDRLGHGTAVAAAIREKAPDAALFVAKVFDRTLATTGRALVDAIQWATAQPVAIINLSLGTANPRHEDALMTAVEAASARGVVIVAAAPQEEMRWLPGALAGVVAVEVDWSCPRDACTIVERDRRLIVRASGFPRPIPGVPPERNLKGQSFAVANATGFLALALEGLNGATASSLADCLGRLSSGPVGDLATGDLERPTS